MNRWASTRASIEKIYSTEANTLLVFLLLYQNGSCCPSAASQFSHCNYFMTKHSIMNTLILSFIVLLRYRAIFLMSDDHSIITPKLTLLLKPSFLLFSRLRADEMACNYCRLVLILRVSVMLMWIFLLIKFIRLIFASSIYNASHIYCWSFKEYYISKLYQPSILLDHYHHTSMTITNNEHEIKLDEKRHMSSSRAIP